MQESQSDAEHEKDIGLDDESESIACKTTEETIPNSETSTKLLKRRNDETASLGKKNKRAFAHSKL